MEDVSPSTSKVSSNDMPRLGAVVNFTREVALGCQVIWIDPDDLRKMWPLAGRTPVVGFTGNEDTLARSWRPIRRRSALPLHQRLSTAHPVLPMILARVPRVPVPTGTHGEPPAMAGRTSLTAHESKSQLTECYGPDLCKAVLRPL